MLAVLSYQPLGSAVKLEHALNPPYQASPLVFSTNFTFSFLKLTNCPPNLQLSTKRHYMASTERDKQ